MEFCVCTNISFHQRSLSFLFQTYNAPSFDAFFDSFIIEQEKPLHITLINTTSTSPKALVSQQPHAPKNTKNPMKKHPKKNKPNNNKAPKYSQPSNSPHNDKEAKSK